MIKQATRSANNINESDSKSSGQKRLNLSSARVDKKIGDSKRQAVGDYLNISSSRVSTKMSSTCSPMSKGNSASPFKFSAHREVESDDECFTSVQREKQQYKQIMEVRVLGLLQASLPDVDMEDLDAQQNSEMQNRQFAPEYAQNCYDEMMLTQNKAIGNYLKSSGSFRVSA